MKQGTVDGQTAGGGVLGGEECQTVEVDVEHGARKSWDLIGARVGVDANTYSIVSCEIVRDNLVNII